MTDVKMVFSIGALSFEEIYPLPSSTCSSSGTKSRWKAESEVVAVFHTNAGHLTLNDTAYSAGRNRATGNPDKVLVADLAKRCAQIELWGATANMKGRRSEAQIVINATSVREPSPSSCHSQRDWRGRRKIETQVAGVAAQPRHVHMCCDPKRRKTTSIATNNQSRISRTSQVRSGWKAKNAMVDQGTYLFGDLAGCRYSGRILPYGSVSRRPDHARPG